MRYLLAPRNRPVLERFARRDLVLVFDFDGTLAPIVADRSAARMRARTRRLFRQVARLYPSAVISGRGLRNIQPRLKGIKLACIIGNHGAEWTGDRGSRHTLRNTVRRWRGVLQERLGAVRGVEIEDKELSLTVHFRKTRDRRKAEAAIRRASRGLPGARAMGGKCIVNILPARSPDKGIAFRQIRKKLGGTAALYVGDDVTDEDVFKLTPNPTVLTIRVGLRRSSRASYYLKDQNEIDELLEGLLTARRAGEESG